MYRVDVSMPDIHVTIIGTLVRDHDRHVTFA
jgi:hypothetical protein